MRERMEIVFVTTAVGDLQPDEELLCAFSCWKVVAVGTLVSMAAARAAGIRVATCPYVVFTEEHCFPEDTWAQAIVNAFENHHADVVGPVVGNANPQFALSWANLCVEYGHWIAPHPGGLMDHLPGHNSAYRSSQLMDLGEKSRGSHRIGVRAAPALACTRPPALAGTGRLCLPREYDQALVPPPGRVRLSAAMGQ